MRIIKGINGEINVAKTINFNIIEMCGGDDVSERVMKSKCKKFEKMFEKDTGISIHLNPYHDNYLDWLWHIDYTSSLDSGNIVILEG